MSGTIITTIKQNCRRCYTCVRDCPAEAIRIEDGQAFVVDERCIACGNCTLVCSQNAKAYLSGLERASWLLEEDAPVAALLAPSFPAGFSAPAGQVVGAFKAAGFDYVVEVAQGADLVSRAYADYLEANPTGVHIATACPAVAEYVRKYHPEMVDRLVPIVSPMVATALAIKELYGDDVRCVFIGPCVAKKAEARDPQLEPVIDEVLTLQEAYRLLAARGVDPAKAAEATWDEPAAGRARVFPLPGGLLESAGMDRGMLDPDVLVVSGHDETIEVLDSLSEADTGQTLLVEALMCRGCYCGPGISSSEPGLLRKRRVGEYVAECRRREAPAERAGDDRLAAAFPGLKLSRSYTPDDQRLPEPTEEDIREILARTNKFFPEDELNCGACGYPTCRAKAVAVHCGMAEDAMCLPFMIDQAERVCAELHVPWSEMRDVHRHIINTEKLASMGQMAAGVAHELNNPLSTILLYTHILGKKLQDRDDLDHDLKLVAEESERCKKIVGNLLDFARQSRVHVERVDVREVVQQAVDSAAATVQPTGHTVELVIDVAPGLRADLDRDQMTQVLVNLVKNGVEAMEGRDGTVCVSANEVEGGGRIHIAVSDEGAGIPGSARDKVFQPFFTTKSIGKGTGLGLPISYGIVKMHNGTIWFDTETDRGTTFHVELPSTHAGGQAALIDDKGATA
ncbi:MAG TPA: [Fe-Fe] hydrogenase large subunit C-terminal domain-containing protein [Thermoleophilia bacterium]|nr:[Fe-Fe] hydrogenase large subunit C-terminal domain-containing protein [Thermoleophilia bacterium]